MDSSTLISRKLAIARAKSAERKAAAAEKRLRDIRIQEEEAASAVMTAKSEADAASAVAAKRDELEGQVEHKSQELRDVSSSVSRLRGMSSVLESRVKKSVSDSLAFVKKFSAAVESSLKKSTAAAEKATVALRQLKAKTDAAEVLVDALNEKNGAFCEVLEEMRSEAAELIAEVSSISSSATSIGSGVGGQMARLEEYEKRMSMYRKRMEGWAEKLGVQIK